MVILGFPKLGGYPNSWTVYMGKSQSKTDDDLGGSTRMNGNYHMVMFGWFSSVFSGLLVIFADVSR